MDHLEHRSILSTLSGMICRVTASQRLLTQAARRLAVPRCVVVRRSGFGASGVVAAARGVVLPTHAPQTTATISWREHQHIAAQNAAASYCTWLVTTTHRRTFIFSNIYEYFNLKNVANARRRNFRFGAKYQRTTSQNAKTLQIKSSHTPEARRIILLLLTTRGFTCLTCLGVDCFSY